MSKPLVSVIVPAFNAAATLRKTIDSIMTQSIGEVEVICVDDGSTDATVAVIRELALQFSGVKLVQQPKNLGVATARNDGIKHATGEFIAFVDADDYYPDQDVLSDLYNAADSNKVDIAGGSMCEDQGNKRIKVTFDGVYAKYTFEEDTIMEYRDYQFDYGYQRFIYKRDLIVNNNISFPPLIRYQDPPFFVRAMNAAGSFAALKRFSYCYRFGHQNLHWGETRACAVVAGMLDVLQYANENNLKQLADLTCWRLVNEYAGRFADAITVSGPKFIKMLFDAEYLLRKSNMLDGSSTIADIIARGVRQAQVKKDNQAKDRIESPRLIGRPAVGEEIVCDMILPSNRHMIEYQWYLGQRRIIGENCSVHLISADEVGKDICCKVTIRPWDSYDTGTMKFSNHFIIAE